jgi:preprotein translocase subunit YajC
MNLLATAGAGSIGVMVLYIAVLGGFMYFIAVRPQKKEQKRLAAMLANLENGDSVLTSSGFYGVVDITDDTVIVEFGNNKNCRIPMQKSAITLVEKANVE